MKALGPKSKAIFSTVSNLEKKHKIITYASLLFLTVSTYFLRSENQSIKTDYAQLQAKSFNLKSNMVFFNRSYEGFPLPVWQKVKRGNKFIIKYINPIYTNFFGHEFEYDKYAIMGKNNFQLFPEKIAQSYYENDVAVSTTGDKLHCNEKFIDKSGKTLDLKVVKWRDIKNNKDTLVYGMVVEILSEGKTISIKNSI